MFTASVLGTHSSIRMWHRYTDKRNATLRASVDAAAKEGSWLIGAPVLLCMLGGCWFEMGRLIVALGGKQNHRPQIRSRTASDLRH